MRETRKVFERAYEEAREKGLEEYQALEAANDVAGQHYLLHRLDVEPFDEFTCKFCKADLSYMANGEKYSRLEGWEIQGGYDGVSFWHCPECKRTWDRFTGEENENF